MIEILITAYLISIIVSFIILIAVSYFENGIVDVIDILVSSSICIVPAINIIASIASMMYFKRKD